MQLEPEKIKWTKETPKIPGFYWFKGGDGCGTVNFTFVTHVKRHDLNKQMLEAVPYMMDFETLLDNFEGEWAGPIDLPE